MKMLPFSYQETPPQKLQETAYDGIHRVTHRKENLKNGVGEILKSL